MRTTATVALLTTAMLCAAASTTDDNKTAEIIERLTLDDIEDMVTKLPLLDLLRGRDGRDGLPGRDGKDGERGPQGEQGPPGPQGLTGPRSAGVTYIRWGKSSCPNTAGTELVYAGRAGGTGHLDAGGGAERLCLPPDPDYINATGCIGVTYYSTLTGVEYQTRNGPLHSLRTLNVPCSVCYASTKAAMLMVPAKTECPSSWTREYYGYLMSEREHEAHHRSSYDCLDLDPDIVPGEHGYIAKGLLSYVLSTCNGFQCPPYEANRVMSCVVCTK